MWCITIWIRSDSITRKSARRLYIKSTDCNGATIRLDWKGVISDSLRYKSIQAVHSWDQVHRLDRPSTFDYNIQEITPLNAKKTTKNDARTSTI